MQLIDEIREVFYIFYLESFLLIHGRYQGHAKNPVISKSYHILFQLEITKSFRQIVSSENFRPHTVSELVAPCIATMTFHSI